MPNTECRIHFFLVKEMLLIETKVAQDFNMRTLRGYITCHNYYFVQTLNYHGLETEDKL